MRPQSVTTTGVQNKVISLDAYGWPDISLQAAVNGTATYTIEQSLDGVTWFPSPIAALVGATTNQQAGVTAMPLYIRLNQTAGAGSVTLVVLQAGTSPA